MKAPMTQRIEQNDMASIVAYCCGNPVDDELPQIADVDDIALDLYHDVMAMPRDTAAAYLHHQMDDEEIFH